MTFGKIFWIVVKVLLAIFLLKLLAVLVAGGLFLAAIA